MPAQKLIRRNPWAWVPSLYLAEGLPYAIVMNVAVILYKGLGVSNTDITFYTSWLYLPWVIKPFWGPVVDILKTRRAWIWAMQILIGGGMAALAMTIPTARAFQYSLACFWLLAFASATQDIAIDGFYMLATTEKEQAFFVGIRNTFYRVSTIIGQGLLVIFAGIIEQRTGNVRTAWLAAFLVVAGMFLIFAIYHRFTLPYPVADSPGTARTVAVFEQQFFRTFGAFFRKKKIVRLLLFLLLYRFAEAQLVKMVAPFLLDPRERGGLGLTTGQVGIAYGTVGIAALMFGGILGGVVASRRGLKFWLWWMVLAIHLPDAVFVYLARAQPDNFLVINLCVAVEQFGYGFGFTAYLLYMIYISRGEHATAHYALCTGFMALGMMLPGMRSGWLQQKLGYPHFFIWVLLATIPGFLVVKLIPLDADFGKQNMQVPGGQD
jgi:PAT family beta-lactamase induction signal transducer AmpG